MVKKYELATQRNSQLMAHTRKVNNFTEAFLQTTEGRNNLPADFLRRAGSVDSSPRDVVLSLPKIVHESPDLEKRCLLKETSLSHIVLAHKRPNLILPRSELHAHVSTPKMGTSHTDELRAWAALHKRITEVLDQQQPHKLESEALIYRPRRPLDTRTEILRAQLTKPKFLKKTLRIRLYNRQILARAGYLSPTYT